MLNNDDGTITFILQMTVMPKTDDVESWITERSSRVTFEFEEMKTRRFEWFLSTNKSMATLIEIFDDSEGALTRFNNLISSPIASEWMERFEVESFTVLGDASHELREALASMEPDFRAFSGGFTRV
ncbi:hypothetical protein N8718_04495 [Luminiphilus sp.]|nr:hypothetical protein [Luminiphilus sp.]